jgi:Ca2+-binding RTX toxin-like protein
VPIYKSIGARPFGLAAVGALAVGFISVGPTFMASASASASASTRAGLAFIANNTLVVTGTNGPDVVSLRADATTAQVAFGEDPANVHQFNLADFTAISVSLGNGDDQFTEQSAVLSDKALTLDGGNGNDIITTGDGKDVIFAGNGDDRVDAGRGNDTVFLGNGNDFFVWNPGEGSDAVDGGNGNDVMQFNGANVNETMSLSANGSRAVFLRDVASIRMDMNDIETFDLNALGGNDNVTVDNLEGTSIRHANIDLSAATGDPDQQADTVTVNGTDQSDHIHVSAPYGHIDVAGLRAHTQITGSDATMDHLQVNTLDGNDKVSVDRAVSALIGVGVDLGPGQA